MAFYTVYSPDGETPVRVRHASHKSALRAAHNSARKNPDKEFFVMRSCSKPITAATPAPVGEGGADELVSA
jgi:hypothetical protein